jgi:hypothetical protein
MREKHFIELTRANACFDGSQSCTAAAVKQEFLPGGFD